MYYQLERDLFCSLNDEKAISGPESKFALITSQVIAIPARVDTSIDYLKEYCLFG